MIYPGLLIQNRYQVLQPLGKGGFGQTFEVDDGGISKVLKVLNLERFYTPETRQKAISLFQREGAVLSRLNHPGIPRVEPDGYFTLAETSSELLYCLVMEKIDGINLNKWMKNRDNQPITQEQAIAWLEQLSEILIQLHQQELIHRDIKPSNILLKPNGQLVLIDFGAVREITDTYLHKQARNITGTVIISIGYTPPEQAEGQSVPQSDFFALGRTFVYLLTGKRPTDFDKDFRTGKLQWRDSAPQVATEFAGLIDYLMDTFPGRRPQTPQMIRRCLQEIITPVPPPTDIPNGKISQTSAPVTPPSKTFVTQQQQSSFFFKASNLLASFFPQEPPVSAWQKVQLRRTLSGHKDTVRAVVITPNGQIMVSGSYDQTIRLWELPSGKLLRTLLSHTHRVTGIAISSDGKLLASSSYDRTIKLWELPSGELLHTLPRQSGKIRYLAFSPDDRTLISTSDLEIKLWVVSASQLLHPLTGRSVSARIATFSPDGQTCIIGSLDGSLELWNPYTSERLHTHFSRFGGITSIAFSPDSRTLASSSGKTIELWEPHLSKRLHSFSTRLNRITSVAFSTDGQTLASGSDKSIELWNWHTGKQLRTLAGHSNTIRSVAFSPDGCLLVSGSDDHTIKIWQLFS
ncbi:MAG: protein kinase [Symploca sp. SIO2G7]|nr:protein kinase [Symploca sp. SIO2G7]